MAVRGRRRRSRGKRICSRRSRRRRQTGGNPSGVLEVSWPGGSTATAAPGPLLSRGITTAKPVVSIHSPKSSFKLLICIDPDVPGPNNPWLHWLITYPGQQQPEELVPWAPPTPPKGSGIHRYQFRLYEAPNPLQMVAPKQRQAFPLESFVAEHGLTLLDEKEVRVKSDP